MLETDVHCVTDRSSDVLFNFINKFEIQILLI